MYKRYFENDPCETGYKQYGMKDKNGKKVPNCVPVEEGFEIDLEPSDVIKGGKFKNKSMTVKGFGTDSNGQPTVITDNGEKPMLKFRIAKLMPEN